MVYGDDLMITSLAKETKEKYPDRQIVIGNQDIGKAYKSIIYKNNPNITESSDIDKSKPIHLINYHNKNRPYIDRKKTTPNNYAWNNNFRARVGELYFSKTEIDKSKFIINNAINFWKSNNTKNYKGIIFLESGSSKLDDPQFKFKHRNKGWGFEQWFKLSEILCKEYLVIQSVHNESIKIDNIFHCEYDFRIACAVMKLSDLYLGPEGGLSHAAAALCKKAVVYFGGWIHPDITGYEFHNNVYVDIKGSPCGAKAYICEHCKTCSNLVSVNKMQDFVYEELN